MTHANPGITRENLDALIAEVNAIDLAPPSLEVLERMVKLVANRFSVPTTATYRVSGKPPDLVTYLNFEWGTPTRYMNVKLDDDGRYHCFHQYCADQYDTLETATSSVAWHYLIGRAYPTVWRDSLLKP
jgi:hypothetical protein